MKRYLSRKDGIILSAIEILDELGIQGLSTKEIAQRQGIAESALYRHFKNKDGILVAVLEYFTRYDKPILSTIQQNPWDARRSMMFFFIAYAEYYENYPQITAIYGSLSAFSRNPATQKPANAILHHMIGSIAKIVAKGQEDGEVGMVFLPEELAVVLVGTFRMIIMEWRMDSYRSSLKEKVTTVMDKLLAQNITDK